MSLVEFFTARRRVMVSFFVMILIFGYFSYNSIPKESDPDISLPMAHVVVLMDGISPEDAKKMILKPLENAIKSVNNIKQITSYASDGSASILVEFRPNANKSQVLQDMRNRVNEVANDIPSQATNPIVKEITLDQFPVLNVAVYGDVPGRQLLVVARDLRDEIEQIPGVLEVSIAGDMEDAVEIVVSPSAIESQRLSISEIANSIVQYNRIVTAGLMRNAGGEYLVKVPALIQDYRELLDFPIRSGGDSSLKIKDIAEVHKIYKMPSNKANVNGKPAIVLEVKKKSGTNIIDVTQMVKDSVSDASKRLPEEVKILYSQDKSGEIADMLGDLQNELFLAGLLVMIIIVIAIGVRSALLVSLSLPASLLSGVLMLHMSGCTMNVVVLFSLILSLGMIVDDAIIVSEYADVKLHQGYGVQEAYISAVTRMFWPIVTTTSVKLVVFFPLLFWPGIVGEFMRYLPITMIVVLTNSLIFALFMQPALAPIIIRKYQQGSGDGGVSMSEQSVGFGARCISIYKSVLVRVLQRPRRFVAVLMSSICMIYLVFINFGPGLKFFPEIEPSSAIIVVRAPGNLSLETKHNLLNDVRHRVSDMQDEVRVFYSKAGVVDDGESYPKDTIGIIELEFAHWQKRRKAKVIIGEILERTQNIDGVIIEVMKERSGPSSSKEIVMNVAATRYEMIAPFVEKLRTAMDDMGGFKDVEDTRPINKIEWHFNIDRELASRYGLSIGDIGCALQMVTGGYKVSSMRVDGIDDEVDVLLKFPPEYRLISGVENIKLINNAGYPVPLSTVLSKQPARGVSTIKSVDKVPVITVKSDVVEGYLADSQIKRIKAWFEDNHDPDITLVFKGDQEEQEEASVFLMVAFITALIIMSLIILLQLNSFYQTFIVMSAVFLSTAGVLLGLMLTWEPFIIVMCSVGIIALAGIVLNNNILLVDAYNHNINSGLSVYDAIIESAMERVRPIFLTAITAVLGLLPMVLGLTIDIVGREVTYDAPSSQWWRQLSTAIAGGLSFATILTLLLTPCLLAIFSKYEHRGGAG